MKVVQYFVSKHTRLTQEALVYSKERTGTSTKNYRNWSSFLCIPSPLIIPNLGSQCPFSKDVVYPVVKTTCDALWVYFQQ